MSKRSLIDSIEVKNECSQDWKDMQGSEKVRFCGHCDFNVNNISALTRKQAMRLVRESNGRICVHYVKNPVDNKPVFADKLYQITRRAGIAAGVLGASLSLSALAYAQNETKMDIPTNKLETSVIRINQSGYFDPIDKETNKTDVNETQIVPLTGDQNSELLIDGMMSFVEYRNGLHLAVSNDDVEAVKSFISKNENINLRDENYSNITPLFLAVENGNAEIAEILLNFGAKINAKDDNRQTPLMRLDEDASLELVTLLIKHGAKVNLADKEGNTALIFASRSVKTEVLQALIGYSSNLNAQNREGRSALMEAADADNLENVRALLLAGANVNLTDKNGESAIDLTTDQEIEKLLAEYGANLKISSN